MNGCCNWAFKLVFEKVWKQDDDGRCDVRFCFHMIDLCKAEKLFTFLRTFIYSNFFERQWEKIYVPLRMTIFYWKVCLLLYHAHFWPSQIKFPEFLPIQWFHGKSTQKRGYTITAAAAIYFFPIMMSLLIQLTRENVLWSLQRFFFIWRTSDYRFPLTWYFYKNWNSSQKPNRVPHFCKRTSIIAVFSCIIIYS